MANERFVADIDSPELRELVESLTRKQPESAAFMLCGMTAQHFLNVERLLRWMYDETEDPDQKTEIVMVLTRTEFLRQKLNRLWEALYGGPV